MAVLVEAISVIIKRSAIDEKWPGGWEAFVRDVPNRTLCFDSFLARVGFMKPVDVKSYVKMLENKGFLNTNVGSVNDLVVANQLHGLSVDCDWVKLYDADFDGPDQRVAVCIHADDKEDDPFSIFTPGWWKYEGSLSQTFIVAPTGHVDKSLKFLRHENGVDVYFNELIGKEVFMGRVGKK